MKLLGLLLATAAFAQSPISPKDRQQLLTHFAMTNQWLALEMEGLSEKQFQFRPSPGAWNIRNVVEHLAIAEEQYWRSVEESLKQTAGDFKQSVEDAAILWYGIDRTERTKTGEAREPKDRYMTAAEGYAAWEKQRRTMSELIRTTEAPLRGIPLVKSRLSVYQWMLMISTHSQRHLLQIQEIKASAGYPKS